MIADLKRILGRAKRGGYAVGMFNACNAEQARGVIAAAEELNSPVIFGTAEVLLPFCPLEMIADMLIPIAERAKVPVAVHYDHGITAEKCVYALRRGFTSVMYDRSNAPYEENVRDLADMVRIAHSFGSSVEGELGRIGGGEGETQAERVPCDFYTDPTQAEDYAARTGVDALAVAVGTVHGEYRFKPKLDFDRIRAIASRVSVPLVLHGGSGLSDDDFRRAVKCGISKINVFTDIDKAAATAALDVLAGGGNMLTKAMPAVVEGVKRAAAEKMLLFGSAGKAGETEL